MILTSRSHGKRVSGHELMSPVAAPVPGQEPPAFWLIPHSSFDFGWLGAIGLLSVLLASPLAAQTTQAWPEIDTYLSLNSEVRVSFFAAATRENREGTSAEIGPNIDFYFKPLMKLKKITVFELDPAKSRLLMLRAGYRYMPSDTGPTEHRGLLESSR